MIEKNNILDYSESTANNPEDYLASSGARFANLILDRIAFFAMIIFIGPFVNGAFALVDERLSAFGFIFTLFMIPGYWILFEYFFGKTPAKFITKTKVVTKYGAKPGFWNIVGRTLCRFIPFEPFSFLGSKPIGWHDSISGTLVVKDIYGVSEADFV